MQEKQEKKVHQIVVGGIATNCWIYDDVVIDPGEEGDRIIAFLDQQKLSPRYIVLTHGHFDHIDAVPVLAARYPDAEVAIHAADAQWADISVPVKFLAEGDHIGPFTVLHLPGHTPGSIGLWDTEAGILFSGDTLFRDGYGRTDLPGGDEAQLFASLKRLFAMDAPSSEGGDIQVFPGHGPSTSIRREAQGRY
jgi:glyoxylase-like metal-dependent hydrolase (beta-lactamase superfamily II)